MADYLRAGARAVGVVNPDDQTLTAHAERGATICRPGETLRGEQPLPGFELPLQSLVTP